LAKGKKECRRYETINDDIYKWRTESVKMFLIVYCDAADEYVIAALKKPALRTIQKWKKCMAKVFILPMEESI
jgi:hypothetical protein